MIKREMKRESGMIAFERIVFYALALAPKYADRGNTEQMKQIPTILFLQ